MSPLPSSDNHDDMVVMPPIVVAADAAYLMPLATTLVSIAENNRSCWPLKFFVLNDGIGAGSRAQVEASVPDGSAVFHWIDIDLKPFQGFQTLPRISKMTFARLALPYVMPARIETVLYLDIDVLVLGSLAELSSISLGDAPLAAVKDCLDLCLHDPSTRAAGVPLVDKYFNAGMLLIHVPQWRKHRISEKALDYLSAHPDTPFADQDAINVAADGLWIELSNVWNFQGHRNVNVIDWHSSRRPHVIHFVTEQKPWKPQYSSVYARIYDSYRSRTRFARNPTSVAKDCFIRLFARMLKVLRNNPSLSRLRASFK